MRFLNVIFILGDYLVCSRNKIREYPISSDGAFMRMSCAPSKSRSMPVVVLDKNLYP